MALVSFNHLMAEAESAGYAVGYFESWNLESLLAVADAAEAARSPVLLGFSGIYLPHPRRSRTDPLSAYAALGLEVCRQLRVPAALVYNESPHLQAVLEAVDHGFSLVMYSEEGLEREKLIDTVRRVVGQAHLAGAAVEGEVAALPGVSGRLEAMPADSRLSDPEAVRDFVEATGVDAMAVNIGQMHFHGRRRVSLQLERLDALRKVLRVPLVLHGATSVRSADLQEAIRLGIRKVNVGSGLKQAYFEALRAACGTVADQYNPYEIIGSGLPADVLVPGRLALQEKVEEFMVLFGSAGKA